MNEKQADRVRNGLVPGRAGKGYSECLINLQDRHGWIPMRVEASPFEDMLLNYDPNEDGEFAQYVADEWGGEQFERLAEENRHGQRATATSAPTAARADGGDNLSIEERAAAFVRDD